MDSSLELLKEEINKTQESEHDLAKWKLGVTAALGAAAFGLSQGGNSHYWLLFFVPFVCAYVDLYAYQYQFRILVIAQFLREHSAGDGFLQQYEQRCDTLRGQKVFSMGDWAGLGSSLGASVIGPVFYLLYRYHSVPSDLLVPPEIAGIIWLVGIFLIAYLWKYYRMQVENICGKRKRTATAG